jgi:hypothetical protein
MSTVPYVVAGCLFVAAGAGCDDSKGGSVFGAALANAFKSTPPAGEVLTKNMKFEDQTEEVEGAPVGITVDPVDGGTVQMQPGQSGSLGYDPAAADPSDPVVARLVYMGGSATHIRLPVADGAQPGPAKFTVDPSVCMELCDVIHQIQCYEAAQTASGTITKAQLTNVILDCQGQEGAEASYSGEWTGTCGESAIDGSFQMCVTAEGGVNGFYSGADSGNLSGTVQQSGGFQTGAGSAGSCSWSGSLLQTSGGGSWTCSGGSTGDCSGTWVAK